jgi:hypothetical protein
MGQGETATRLREGTADLTHSPGFACRPFLSFSKVISDGDAASSSTSFSLVDSDFQDCTNAVLSTTTCDIALTLNTKCRRP